MGRQLKLLFKLLWVGLAAGSLVLHGWLTMRWRFPRVDAAQRQALTQSWARRMLRLFGVRLQLHGPVPTKGPLLLVANHISWLDILVLLAAAPVQFVARQENQHWPVLGWMTQQAGAVFVQRSSPRDMAKAIRQVGQYLQRDAALIALFPEGKTGLGLEVASFHGNMLQAALDSGSPVQAVALDYRLQANGQRTTAVSYASPLTLWQSLLNTLAEGPYWAQLHFGAASKPSQVEPRPDRKDLATQLRLEVLALRQPR